MVTGIILSLKEFFVKIEVDRTNKLFETELPRQLYSLRPFGDHLYDRNEKRQIGKV